MRKKQAKPIAILHLLPLEKYPPVMNFIRTLEQTALTQPVDVYTTYPDNPAIGLFIPENSAIRIIRGGSGRIPRKGLAATLARMLYLLWVSARLIWSQPSAILYYETFSVFPVWLAGVCTGWKSKLLVHYHEYVSPGETRSAPLLFRVFSRLEQKIWPRAAWISQTHALRMERLISDYPGLLPLEALKIVPNYPPESWRNGDRQDRTSGKKLVYVGVLGLDTMYLPEVSAWLDGPGEEYTLDMYAFQVNADVRKFLKQSGSSRIRLHDGVNYYDLPDILRSYDIGLILYKGHIPNYTLIAPNKLFEYLSCGLEVWLPQQMVGSLPYVSSYVKPRVLAVDFENLSGEVVRIQPPEHELPLREEVYICEQAFRPLMDALTQEN